MKRKIYFLIGIAGMVAIFFAWVTGLLYPLNNLIPNNPDRSCTVDADCILVQLANTGCSPCGGSCNRASLEDDEVIAMNKDWSPFCPMTGAIGYLCAQCIGIIEGVDDQDRSRSEFVKCISNRCEKVIP